MSYFFSEGLCEEWQRLVLGLQLSTISERVPLNTNPSILKLICALGPKRAGDLKGESVFSG